MDGKVGDWVVTPRIGKPVEMNAVWYSVLRIMLVLSGKLKKNRAAQAYKEQADRVGEAFRRRFWFEEGGYLYDVIDAPHSPRGCFAQAWSVAEILRCYRELEESETKQRNAQ